MAGCVSHRCHPILVAFVWELTKEAINLPLGCLQGGHTEDLVEIHLFFPQNLKANPGGLSGLVAVGGRACCSRDQFLSILSRRGSVWEWGAG